MYKIILATSIIFSSLATVGFSQKQSNTNYRLATEGGGQQVVIDKTTPTALLIKELKKPLSFKTTGKAYYIGYTDLMFSIADKGDSIIGELMQHFKISESQSEKLGIIYTLHLIGIKGKVAGRTYESFKSQKARNALLSLIQGGTFNSTIARLLARDPWLSDVPVLMNYLEHEKNTDYTWPVVKALIRYNPPDFCIGQAINKPAQSYTITNPGNAPYLLEDSIFNVATKNSLRLFEATYPRFINVEQALFEQNLNGDCRVGSEATVKLIGFIGQHSTGSFYLFSALSSFSHLGSRFVHYLEEDQLYFCSMETAQKRIVDWWSRLDRKERAFFKNKNFYNHP